jgi:hypothetical protein
LQYNDPLQDAAAFGFPPLPEFNAVTSEKIAMTDYEQGFKDGVERAAQKVCLQCQQGYPLEDLEVPAPDGSRKVYPCHQHPNKAFAICGASDIRALTPGYWRQLPLTPQTMGAMFHEIFTRLAPQFRYKIRDDIYGAQTLVNVYRAALQHIATHAKDTSTRDDAIQALLEAPHLPLWDPQPWDQACELNRRLTIAVCAEMLAKFGTNAQ